jgi:histidinol phosphatase-like enzyme
MTASALRPAAFFDLNGTLVVPVTPNALTDYEAIDCATEAVRMLSGAGFVCPVITVQSKIGKGLFTEEEFQRSWPPQVSHRVGQTGTATLGVPSNRVVS